MIRFCNPLIPVVSLLYSLANISKDPFLPSDAGLKSSVRATKSQGCKLYLQILKSVLWSPSHGLMRLPALKREPLAWDAVRGCGEYLNESFECPCAYRAQPRLCTAWHITAAPSWRWPIGDDHAAT